jgi:uncharacterized membrane protein
MNTSRLIPAGLIALATVPMIAGTVELATLSTSTAPPANPPLPVVVHIVAASLYCVLGAFQFAPRFRREHPRWHRTAGWIVVPAGLAVALTGLWMSVFYQLPATDGRLLEVFRLIVGTIMGTGIVLAVWAIRKRDIRRHRAWMIRAYALGQGAGTQVLTNLPWVVTLGQPGVFPRAMLMLAGWVINVAVAEWIIRRSPRRRQPAQPQPVAIAA